MPVLADRLRHSHRSVGFGSTIRRASRGIRPRSSSRSAMLVPWIPPPMTSHSHRVLDALTVLRTLTAPLAPPTSLSSHKSMMEPGSPSCKQLATGVLRECAPTRKRSRSRGAESAQRRAAHARPRPGFEIKELRPHRLPRPPTPGTGPRTPSNERPRVPSPRRSGEPRQARTPDAQWGA